MSEVKIHEVPQEVFGLIDGAMTPEVLKIWWKEPINAFDMLSPYELWIRGEQQKVIDLINSVKSGDMA